MMELKYAKWASIIECVVIGGAIALMMKHFQLNLGIIYSFFFQEI
jgi:hypothetical protein